MKAIVVYDSMYGNTEKIARVVAESLNAKMVRVDEIKAENIKSVDLLVVGSPTQGGQPTEAIRKWLESLPDGELKDKKVAAFDTRLDEKVQKTPIKLLLKVIGYAAPKIEEALVKRGGTAAEAEGFIVEGKEGPLREGEPERAKKWVNNI